MTEFVINITYKGTLVNLNIGECEEFPEAIEIAKYQLKEQGITDYTINCLKAISGEYEGEMVKGENIDTLFITKNEILKGLQDGTIGIGCQDDCVTAYMADNFFYFDSDYINELLDKDLSDEEIANLYLKEHTTYEIAEKIHQCLEEFVTEFPMEYWLYKLCLTHDNKDNIIKIDSIKQLYVDFASPYSGPGLYDVKADAVDEDGNEYVVYWNYADSENNPDAYAGYSDDSLCYDDYNPDLIVDNNGEVVTAQCEIIYSGDNYKKEVQRNTNRQKNQKMLD